MTLGEEAAPYQIVCEGRADQVFLSKLILARFGEAPQIAIRTSGNNRPPQKDGLTNALLAIDAIRSTMPGAARGVAIIQDADDDANKAFKQIINHIKAAKVGYPIPVVSG